MMRWGAPSLREFVGKSSPIPSSSIVIRHCSTLALTSPRLFISGLSRLTTDEKLKEAFSPFGQLLDGKVVRDRASGRSKGFGFITYSTIEEAENARQGMNAKFLDGWVIFVDPAKPKFKFNRQSQPESESHAGFTTNKTVGWCG